MRKVFSAILMIVLILAVLAGCGGKQASNAGNNLAAKTADEAKADTSGISAAEKTEASKEPITLTLFTKDTKPYYDNGTSRIAKKITELTGVTIKMEFPVGDLKQKIGLMIASNDYPDMIFAGDQGQPQLIEAGAFIKLDEYYEKYGQNLKRMFGEYFKRLRYSKEDPSIYIVGSPNPGVGQQPWRPNMALWIAHPVVKELGYPKLKTLADAENAIKTYFKNHPTVDGKPTIPLTTIAEDWRWLCAPGNMAAFVTGKPDDGQWYINPDTYEATYRFYLPDHRDFYRWLNKMNAQGLFDKEAFTQKYDQYLAKLSSGRVLAVMDQRWEIDPGLEGLRKDGKEDKSFGAYPVQLNDSYVCADLRDMGYSGGWGIGITTSCKDPVRAFQLLDWFASDEAQVLIHWGIEGIDYKVENGKRVIPPEIWDRRINDAENYCKESGIGNYNHPFPAWGDGVKDSTGNYYTTNTREQLIENLTPTEKEVLAAYGAQLWVDLYPQPSDLPVSKWGAAWQIPISSGSEIDIILNKCNSIMQQGIPKAVLAKPSEFESVWDGLMDELRKAGVEKMNAEFTKLVKERIELWNN